MTEFFTRPKHDFTRLGRVDGWLGRALPRLFLQPLLQANTKALQWRHNGCDGVLNHQPHDCLLNRLFRRKSKKTSKLRVTGLCAGNSPGTGEFTAQMASYAEYVSIWWRHHGKHKSCEGSPTKGQKCGKPFHVPASSWRAAIRRVPCSICHAFICDISCSCSAASEAYCMMHCSYDGANSSRNRTDPRHIVCLCLNSSLLDKMAAISQTTFSWTKSFVFWFKFYWSFFPKGPIDNKPAWD